MSQDETAQISKAWRESEDNESESNRDERHLHWKLCVRIVVQEIVQTFMSRDHALTLNLLVLVRFERRSRFCSVILMLKVDISNSRDEHSIIVIDVLHRHACHVTCFETLAKSWQSTSLPLLKSQQSEECHTWEHMTSLRTTQVFQNWVS